MPINLENRLNKLEAAAPSGQLGETLAPMYERWKSRPLWTLADFDLNRLEVLAQGDFSVEAVEELGERLAHAAKDGVLRSMPSASVLLEAIEEERSARKMPMARNGRPDHRPHPQGGPGAGVCGLYHSALDPAINSEGQAAKSESTSFCAVCLALDQPEPHDSRH